MKTWWLERQIEAPPGTADPASVAANASSSARLLLQGGNSVAAETSAAAVAPPPAIVSEVTELAAAAEDGAAVGSENRELLPPAYKEWIDALLCHAKGGAGLPINVYP